MKNRIMLVDLRAQYLSIKDEIDQAIANVVNDTAFVGGKYVCKFEDEFAVWLGTKHCIGCGNGTDSLEILLKAIGIVPGDEVIVPAHTWISTAEAVTNVGGIPVFAETHPRYYTILPEDIRNKVTLRTKAIIPVHLYGLPADMGAVMAIAGEHNLKVIEDCAQAHGATYNGRKVGTIGHAGSFSFYPGKNLGAYGDAGCMVTNDEGIAMSARMIANHGQLKKHDHRVVGRNSRLDGLQAGILSAKLRHLDDWNLMRQARAAYYNEQFQGLDMLLPTSPDGSAHVYHLYVIQTRSRDQLMYAMQNKGIEVAVHYPHSLPMTACYSNLQRKVGDPDYFTRLLSLPIYPELTENLQREVVQVAFESSKGIAGSSRNGVM